MNGILTTGIESIEPTIADANQTATKAPPPYNNKLYVLLESICKVVKEQIITLPND